MNRLFNPAHGRRPLDRERPVTGPTARSPGFPVMIEIVHREPDPAPTALPRRRHPTPCGSSPACAPSGAARGSRRWTHERPGPIGSSRPANACPIAPGRGGLKERNMAKALPRPGAPTSRNASAASPLWSRHRLSPAASAVTSGNIRRPAMAAIAGPPRSAPAAANATTVSAPLPTPNSKALRISPRGFSPARPGPSR